MSAESATKEDAVKLAAEIEAKLKQSGPFLGGEAPSAEDAEMFKKLLGSENSEIARWAKHIESFSEKERKAWRPANSGPTKAERKAAFAAGEGQGLKVVAKKETTGEKAHKDCLDMMPEHPSFPNREVEVGEHWKKVDAFHTSLKQSAGKPVFTFYDGPPFATGLPHYGHILAGTIKDIVCRWAHQTGHHVERRFGWDCHGLPIEFEIEKEHGIKSSHDVMKIGIKKYNQYCRDIVMKFSTEWETTVTRMGRWIDFKNDYKTMNLSYMESVWWVFSELWKKDLIYRGYKVMPYSIGCTTVLSNFEANMNYKQVSDPSVVVTFPWLADESISFLAWTTTPWTLPSNLMLCVNPTLEYVLIQDVETSKKYILAEARLVQAYPKLSKLKPKDKKPFTILEKYVGKDLVGREYKPLFNFFFEKKKKDGCFKIISDSYVTSEGGTGIVHQAPGFGEDDYRCCKEAGVIEKNEEVPCPVDANGCFTNEVSTWEGIMVKDADKAIQKELKDMGRLWSAGSIVHDYPFCWRSEKPLIYKTVSSWFVNVTEIKEDLIKNNKDTYWVPESVQVGRFNNWLENARDWAVSRNRYWGTPLPIWMSEDEKEMLCMDSVEKLEKYTGKKITDIHRDSIDDLVIPDPRGEGYPPMKRVSEVFDCWFESGSMPYAQSHYPFENKEKFENGFPADFIAEGIDQTRGWFYTLLVLSTAMFNKPPFKNLIVNGLVLASDGQKMSKRKRNYPPPTEVIDKYGADALRLYLINSPIVKGQDLKFNEENVKKVVKDVLLPLYNSLNFFTINYNRLIIDGEKFASDVPVTNTMDRWITAEAQRLIKDVTDEMKKYHLYTVVPLVLKWVDNLTNCYLRMNRKRMKGNLGVEDQKASLATLYNILMVTSKVMAAFTPFMAEQIFQQLKQLVPDEEKVDSVHYLMVPATPESFDDVVIRKVERLQKGLGNRKPLREVIVVHSDPQYVSDVLEMSEYVKEETNCFELTCTSKEEEFVIVKAEADNAKIGKKYGKDGAAIKKAILADQENIAKAVMKDGKVTVAEKTLLADEIKLVRSFKESATKHETFTDGETLVLCDVTQDEQVVISGTAREVIARVQQLRKRAGLEMTDKVKVFFETEDEILSKTFAQKLEMIEQALQSTVRPSKDKDASEVLIAEQEIEELGLTLSLTRA